MYLLTHRSLVNYLHNFWFLAIFPSISFSFSLPQTVTRSYSVNRACPCTLTAMSPAFPVMRFTALTGARRSSSSHSRMSQLIAARLLLLLFSQMARFV